MITIESGIARPGSFGFPTRCGKNDTVIKVWKVLVNGRFQSAHQTRKEAVEASKRIEA